MECFVKILSRNTLHYFFSFRFISPGGEESTEDIVQQVVEKALLNAKAEELRSQVNGVKKLFTSLAHSVANFRETGNITYDQALAFYDHGFTVTFQINTEMLDYYAIAKSGLTLSLILLKNSQTYLKNLAVFTQQDFQSMFGHISTSCMKVFARKHYACRKIY